jgi:DNA-binding response OmpR family regulator
MGSVVEQRRRVLRGAALVVSEAPEVANGLVGALRDARIEVLRTARCIEALALVDVVAPQVVLVDARLAGARALCR